MNFFQRLIFRFFPPKSIVVIINGEDVREAGWYTDIGNCLMATALKLRGHREVSVSAHDALILGSRFRFDGSPILESWAKGGFTHFDPSSVIGTRFELTRV